MEKLAVSVAEAAKMLGISAKTMYELVNTEGFPCRKLEGRYLISVKGLEKWLEGK